MPDRTVTFWDLGAMDYDPSMVVQEQVRKDVMQGARPATVLMVSYPPLVTCGKHSDPRWISTQNAIPVFQTERGGQVTAHEPGQLVAYPIVPLSAWGLSVKDYVCLLEETAIALLAHFGIESRRAEGLPGIWVAHNKVCALGVRIKQRVSTHGLALNVENSLASFSEIVPCGIAERGVISMRALGYAGTFAAVVNEFSTIFCETFGAVVGVVAK